MNHPIAKRKDDQIRNGSAARLLVAIVLFTGCPNLEAAMPLENRSGPRRPTARAIQEGLEISVEEFISRDKSQQMFGSDLASSKLLALFVRAENEGARRYSLRRKDIKLSVKGKSLTQLAPIDASAVYTGGVNKRIEEVGYQDALIGPRENTFGFVYFKVEEPTVNLENLIVELELSEEQSGTKLSYKLSLPELTVGQDAAGPETRRRRRRPLRL